VGRWYQVLFKAALVILAGALGAAKVRKRASGLCETLEVLRHPPEPVLAEEYLVYHMQRLGLTEEDFEFEHQRQTTRRRAMANRRYSNRLISTSDGRYSRKLVI
jgi:TBC1 domain family member 10